jgi:hypothetical protein
MIDKRDFKRISRRQSKRISARVHFEVSGRDENGRRFALSAETRNVCREGGCLILDRDIKPGDYLRLTSVHGMNFATRVHWCLFDPKQNVRWVGFRLLDRGKSWVVLDLPQQKRMPVLSPVQSAEPEIITLKPAGSSSGSPNLMEKLEENPSIHTHLIAMGNATTRPSFWGKMTTFFHIPSNIIAGRLVTIFKTE